MDLTPEKYEHLEQVVYCAQSIRDAATLLLRTGRDALGPDERDRLAAFLARRLKEMAELSK